ncbi:MAG: hypothetical protein ACJ76D_10900 [Solirubrobacterales bacterium]
MNDRGPAIAAWKLPLIVAGIAVAIIAAFYVGGPGMGMAEGSLVAGVIVVMAVRNPPLAPIVPARSGDRRERLLVVVDEPLEDGGAIEQIAAASVPPDPAEPEPEVRVVAPAHNRFLDRWTSDTGPGRDRAQRNLVLSLAALAGAGVDATARIGDEDVVQTVTDQLRDYPATEVFLVTPEGASAAAAEELRSRLHAPLHVIGRDRRHPTRARCPEPPAATQARPRGTIRNEAVPLHPARRPD